MKNRKPTQYKIPYPVMSDRDFRKMLEGVLYHRENLIRYGTPFPPEQPNSEKIAQRKSELDTQINDCKAKIKLLEDEKERYNLLLRTIYEEESRVKDEQKKKTNSVRTDGPNSYLQTH